MNKCYFLHGCRWEKKDGKKHNPCLAPDNEPCAYRIFKEKPLTQAKKIAKAIAARDKWWINKVEKILLEVDDIGKVYHVFRSDWQQIKKEVTE